MLLEIFFQNAENINCSFLGSAHDYFYIGDVYNIVDAILYIGYDNWVLQFVQGIENFQSFLFNQLLFMLYE